MIQVAVSGCRQLQCPEANVIEGFVVDTESFIGVLDKLVNGEGCIIGLRIGTLSMNTICVGNMRHTSTTVSETLGLGTTEYVHIILSGYSSRIFEIRRVPIPAPVPPPSECVIWKPG